MPDNEKDDKEIQIRNTIALFHFSAASLYLLNSVRDPWHFGTDPDPRIRTCD
jgi:hypothetical protein